uniref:Uncharacterized protein n=1 Tax=Strigamia maritima TaxID=126957 RepID=T1IU63_STRMM
MIEIMRRPLYLRRNKINCCKFQHFRQKGKRHRAETSILTRAVTLNYIFDYRMGLLMRFSIIKSQTGKLDLVRNYYHYTLDLGK